MKKRGRPRSRDVRAENEALRKRGRPKGEPVGKPIGTPLPLTLDRGFRRAVSDLGIPLGAASRACVIEALDPGTEPGLVRSIRERLGLIRTNGTAAPNGMSQQGNPI